MRPALFEHAPLADHALLDSGEGAKLERFGEVLLARPDPQALWPRRLAPEAWESADLAFVRESDRGGRWEARPNAHADARGREPGWTIGVGGARVLIRPTPFKHVGLFPEQATNWRFVAERRAELGSEPALLNLFGYTGVASVLAARDGWRVTHVDASKRSLAWARENAVASGCDEDMRFLLDDAAQFVRREVRRGSRYAGILVDPPHYGRGPKGEKWQLEEGLAPLVQDCARLLAERALLVLSTYAIGISAQSLSNLLAGALEGGELEAGELALPEEPGGPSAAGSPRFLPCGFCARWWR